MASNEAEIKAATERPDESESDQDPQLHIPLRQRRLPASFWQEPCPSQSPRNQEISPLTSLQTSVHQYPSLQLHPWSLNSNSTFPVFSIPQRFTVPSHFLIQQNSEWMRASSNCNCATCLNYSYVMPRLPDVYNGLRYRASINAPCCSSLNCSDQNCKLCTEFYRWHPERLRHLRLRAARYNAILD